MNPMNFLQLKPAWDQFRANHPKLIQFIKASSQPGVMDEDTLVEINIKNSSGKNLASNFRVKQSDLQFIQALRDMLENEK